MNPSTPKAILHHTKNGRRSISPTSTMNIGGSNNKHNHHNVTHHYPISGTTMNVIRVLILSTLAINAILCSFYGFSVVTTIPTTPFNTLTTNEATTVNVMNTDSSSANAASTLIRRRVSIDPSTPLEAPVVVSHRKSILVTGGAGFVGSHVVEYLLTLQKDHNNNDVYPYDIIVIDEVNDYYDTTIKESNLLLLRNISLSLASSSLSPESTPSLYVYRGDICNTTLLDMLFTQHTQIVSICHMAARAGVRPSIENPYVYIHSNIIGTITLLQYAVQYKIQNFVFASSSSVYGGSISTYFTETEPVDHPISPYAATKKSCELFSYMYAYHHQLNITALRFFTVYGPRGRPDMAPYKFIHAISNHIPIQQYGDGTSSRDYTYISDIVSGVVKSLLYHPSKYSIYNLGKGNGTTLNDFVHYVEAYVNTSATIQLLPDQPGDVPYTCANITMAQVDLQYQPLVPFPKGIQQTVQWYQQRQQQVLTVSSAKSSSEAKPNSRLGRPTSRRLLQQQELPAVMEVIPFDDEMMDTVPSLTATHHQRYDFNHKQGRRHQQRRKLQETIRPRVVAPSVGHKKIAVSGGISANAFVGRHVIEALLLRGDDVVLIDDDDANYDVSTSSHSALLYLKRKYGTDHNGHTTKAGQLSIHLGHRNNSTFLEHIFHHEQPTHVIHFGLDQYALSLDDELERSKMYVEKNVEILVRLLEVSKSSTKMSPDGTLVLKDPIQNFVFTSSDAVYGYEAASTKTEEALSSSSSKLGQYILWNETDRVDYPKSSYGASMKSAELLGYTYHHLYKIPISILRLFNVYGPHQTPKATNPSFQLFDMLVQGKANDASESSRSDEQTLWDSFDFSTMDYAYVDDIVRGIVSSIDRSYEYEIFNLGSGSSNCIDGITNLIRSITTELSLSEIQTERILNDFQVSLSLQSDRLMDGISCANIQKAQDLLQYTPYMTTLLSHSVNRTIQWHHEQSLLALTVANHLPLPIEVTENVPIERMNPQIQIPLMDASGDQLTSDIVVTVAVVNSNVTKLCPTGVIVLLSNHPNYPRWLRQLAFTQWLIVVVILIFRFTYKVRGGGLHRSTSSSTLLSLQQQQQLTSSNTQTKEGRASPRRERV